MLIQDVAQGVILSVHIQPKAARTEYVGIHGEAYKFRIMAPPVEGAANEELCRYLSSAFSLPMRSVTILSGQHGRRKRVLIKGLDGEQVQSGLLGLLSEGKSKIEGGVGIR